MKKVERPPTPASASAAFVAWALDPARTLEERYVVECVLPPALGFWRHQHQIQVRFDGERLQAQRKYRQLHPAYEPVLHPQEVRQAAECLFAVEYASLGNHGDRAVRVVAGVEFLPNLKTLSIHGQGVRDFERLGALTKLDHLSLVDPQAEELGGLGACRQLRELIVYSQRPWPRLAGWEGMVGLEKLTWHGNLLVMEDVPRLERLVTLKLHPYPGQTNVPLRDARRLPSLPRISSLTIEAIHRLDGLERYPALRNLVVAGPIHDLQPLAKLSQLTHLSITSNELEDITPLTALTELRYLRVVGEQPLDWFVLSDLPHLHEIEVKGCEANTTEVDTLQEVLPAWDTDFRAEPPRPLGPMRLIVWDDQQAPFPGVALHTGDGPAAWQGDQLMQCSEQRWHGRRLTAALTELLGNPKACPVNQPVAFGYDYQAQIRVATFAAAMRLPDIVEVVRKLLAESRFPRMIPCIVDTDPVIDFGPEDEDGEVDEITQAERDRQDEEYYAKQREERARFLERQHRWRIQQQEGGKIRPAEFAPEAEPPKPPPEPAEPDSLVPEFNARQRVFVYGWITEAGLYIARQSLADAEQLMTQAAENRESPEPST